MNNVRTDSLIIKDVRKTGREPAVNRVMSTPVRPDAFTLLQTGVLMILLTVNAAPHPPLPDVRLTTASTVPAPHPALTPAVIPVTVVVPIPYVGSSECGSCYACSDTCRTGSKSVSCSSSENKVRVSSTECGSSCYSCQYNSDCSVTSKSCSYGCASYNSCGKCTSCDSCSNSCSTGSTSSYCSSGYTAKAVGSTQCGNTCYTCVADEPDDPCEGVSGKNCSSGYHCSSYGSCGECTACAKDEVKDPCAGVTCPTAKSCSYGCASYSTATSCCSRVCTSCKSHTHSYSCPSGYQSSSCGSGYTQSGTTSKVCSSCGATSGTCYKCKKENPIYVLDGTFTNSSGEYCTYSCSCSFPVSGYTSSCCSIDGCF